VAWFLLIIPAIYFIQLLHLAIVLRWSDERTFGVNYYGLPPAGRDHFKCQLKRQAEFLYPILWLNQHTTTFDFRRARIRYKGISAPSGSCSIESFAAAEAYEPRSEDIFVVTQMRCGTTWMQHLVFQILHRGKGDLVETGRALYAVSSWIEGRKSVPIDQAPLFGSERPSRIIKTHLPVGLCPYSPGARYIYVCRHPVSCFASCIDFLVANVGLSAPSLPRFEEWFMSQDLMWWGTWTSHVKAWWGLAQSEKNVLFVRYEDMKQDLAPVAQRVAAFLGVQPLSSSELANVAYKCSFEYMRAHHDNFEMYPPHILRTVPRLFVSGSVNRLKDVPPDVSDRIARWAAQEMSVSSAAGIVF
jgi:hypothetical protein